MKWLPFRATTLVFEVMAFKSEIHQQKSWKKRFPLQFMNCSDCHQGFHCTCSRCMEPLDAARRFWGRNEGSAKLFETIAIVFVYSIQYRCCMIWYVYKVSLLSLYYKRCIHCIIYIYIHYLCSVPKKYSYLCALATTTPIPKKKQHGSQDQHGSWQHDTGSFRPQTRQSFVWNVGNKIGAGKPLNKVGQKQILKDNH